MLTNNIMGRKKFLFTFEYRHIHGGNSHFIYIEADNRKEAIKEYQSVMFGKLGEYNIIHISKEIN